MNRMHLVLKQLIAGAIVACQALHPAYALITDISSTPLSSGTVSVLPNLLYILDDSSSMDWDFNGDYVDSSGGLGNAANAAMRRSDGSRGCNPGDPCYYSGGGNGFNGIYYDPLVNYKPGLKYDGTTVLPATFTTTGMTGNAYISPASTSVNLTNNTVSKDRNYCNASSGGVCKRNGADTSGTLLVSGGTDADSKSDGTTFTMNAGQFPFRAHASNSSAQSFGLPEMMSTGLFSRAGTTVTVDTIAPHNLATGARIFVANHATSSINTTSVTVTNVNATRFTYTSGSSGTVAASDANWRPHVAATSSRAGTTVTVTSTAHGLQNGDIISTFQHATGSMNANNVTIGGVTANTFTYTSGTSGTVTPATAMTWVRNGLYNVLQSDVNRNPIAYRITPVEYCSDPGLTTCTLATTPGVAPIGFGFPAYVRFCKTSTDAYSPGAVSGNSGTTPRCVSKFVESGSPTYYFVRYGLFTRDNIVSTTGSYTGRVGRADCLAAPTCTYAEEIQNYARWYAYYRTRMMAMKTASGRAFQPFVSKPTNVPPIPNKMRIGFITINPKKNTSGTTVTNIDNTRYLKVDDFSGQTATSHAANWFNLLYSYNTGSSNPRTIPGTPLRQALSTAGWIFAGKLGSGLTAGLGAADDPVQVACQRNFALLTTDGYWNGAAGQKLDAGAMDNQDSTDPTTITGYTDPVVSRASGTYDGGLLSGATAGGSAGGAGTLADVALYYYKTKLREGGSASGPTKNLAGTGTVTLSGLGVVPTKPGNKDFITHQHMVTFGVGMSDGLLRYQADYETAAIGDFASIKAGTSGACAWAAGATCNWPSPQENSASALDDLWHAAVNGRGSYYSARDTNLLATGLESALVALNVQVAAAAASATSSPNITQTDRQIFSTTYETDTWSGRIVAQNIDPSTGNVEPAILWSADTLFVTGTGPGKVAAASDTRTIKTFSAAGTDKVKDFSWATLNATEQAYFTNKCTPVSNMGQCAAGVLTPGQVANLNSGANMVGYLRGWTGLELTADLTAGSFRDRKFIDPASGAVQQTVLGDTINAKPAYVRRPLLNYNDSVQPSNYNAFKSEHTASNGGLGRSPRLYVGANDGFLHAFNGDTGIEEWAYLPRFLMPGLWALANKDYRIAHTYFVDGTPESADVFHVTDATTTPPTGVWKTILVGGVNNGGRGFYALDVTDPSTPKALWEFCSDAALCAVSDPNLGFSFGNPVIGKRSSDGKWVVVLSSGLNNVGPSGDGKGYFYVLDVISGAILNIVPVDATVGSTGTPSGLMKIAGFYESAFVDATFRYVYGGDQLGNVWRMDMGTAAGDTPTVLHLTTLKDDSTPPRAQPITTKPVLSKVGTSGGPKRVMFIGTGRYLGGKDLKDPAAVPVDDPTVSWKQTLYAFKDKEPADSPAIYGAAGSQNLRADATLVTQVLTEPTTQTRTTSINPVNWNSDDGWMIDFSIGAAGERINIDPELILGTLVVTTNVPVAATTGVQCSVGGDSWQYQFDYKSGTYLSTAPNQVAGQKLGAVVTVGVAVVQLPSGAIKGIVTSADTSKNTIGIQLGAGAGSVRRFSYRER